MAQVPSSGSALDRDPEAAPSTRAAATDASTALDDVRRRERDLGRLIVKALLLRAGRHPADAPEATQRPRGARDQTHAARPRPGRGARPGDAGDQ
jgi:hypothetical protein